MSARKQGIVIALLACMLVAGCGKKNAGQSLGEQVQHDQAEVLYRANCMACHAADLSGGVGPNLQKVGVKLSRVQITDQLVAGGDKMPPFGSRLTKEDIGILAQWLATQQ